MVLRPSASLRALLPNMLSAETSEAQVTGEEWSPLDRWLSKSEQGDEDFAPTVPSWTIQSSGHMHSHFFGRGTFEALGLSPPLCEAMAECGYTQPSTAQVASFKAQARGQDVVLAQPSGSGKTLAYLAPLLQRLAEAEASEGRTPPGTARAIILVPSSDLAQQVVRVAKSAAGKAVPLRVALVTSEYPMATQRDRLAGGVELCVATLGRLQAHLERSPAFDLRGLRSLVIDEADTLYAEPPLRDGVAQIRAQLPPGCATTLVTAALPAAVVRAVESDLPRAKLVRGKDLHTTRPGVQATLLDCSAEAKGAEASFASRLAALRRAMQERPDWRTLVLCNTPATADRLVAALREPQTERPQQQGSAPRAPSVRPIHSEVAASERAAALEDFSAPPSSSPTARATNSMVLVGTDRAVRGLDFPRLEHLCLFDFPRDATEYLRRVGSATRGPSAPARLTLLAVGRQLSFARALLALDEQGRPLDLEHSRRS